MYSQHYFLFVWYAESVWVKLIIACTEIIRAIASQDWLRYCFPDLSISVEDIKYSKVGHIFETPCRVLTKQHLTNLLRFFLPTGFYFCYNLTSSLSYLSLLSFSHLLLSPFILALLSQFTSHLPFFFLSLPCLVSYFSFSLALCTRLNWQFSVSFQVHVKSSSSYRIVSQHVNRAMWTYQCYFVEDRVP